MLKVLLACMWSLNGPLERRVLDTCHPDAYAATKALAVTIAYAISRRPIDPGVLAHPAAWLLVAVSSLNTPVYARVVARENPALVLPFVASLSHVVRLAVTWALERAAPTPAQLLGFALVLVGGALLQH